MAKPTGPDWFIQEWAASKRLTQADFRKALDLEKNAAFRLWHGVQPYRRDYVNLAARWLSIAPYELLMRPEEANAIRKMKEAVVTLAHSNEPERQPAPIAAKSAAANG